MIGYLGRIVQRSLSTAPHDLLLPRVNYWIGAMDPFENTLLMPAQIPNQPEPGRSGAKWEATGQLLSTPMAYKTTLNKTSPEDHPIPGIPPFHLKPPALYPGPTGFQPVAADTGQAGAHRKTSGPDPAEPAGGAVSTSFAKMKITSGSRDQGKPEPDGPAAVLRQVSSQPQIRRVRGYLDDTPRAPAYGSLPEQENPISEHADGTVPQQALPLLEKRSIWPCSQPSGSTPGPRPGKKAPPDAPRLVIGRLNVEVVAATDNKTTYRHRAPLKQRAHTKYGRLTQAEASRTGFGIGQM